MKWREGGCHCAAVRFRVRADWESVEIIECNCSICAKKAYLHLIVGPQDFELLSSEDAVTAYRFNTGVAVHKFCSTCGIHAYYTPRSHPDDVSVNLRCVEGFDAGELNVVPFDGQHWEQNIDSIT